MLPAKNYVSICIWILELFEKFIIFPVTNMVRQEEIIWLVLVVMSVAYFLWILLAGSAIFDCYMSPSL